MTRATLLTLFREALSVEPWEREVDRTELYIADEAFFAGTAAEVTPILSVDRHPIGDGAVGPLTAKVRDAYFQVGARRREPSRVAHARLPLSAPDDGRGPRRQTTLTAPDRPSGAKEDTADATLHPVPVPSRAPGPRGRSRPRPAGRDPVPGPGADARDRPGRRHHHARSDPGDADPQPEPLLQHLRRAGDVGPEGHRQGGAGAGRLLAQRQPARRGSSSCGRA